jgi:putative Holliday junction resolvase
MRPGVRLGVDVGSVRVGVATCDPAGILATPVETLQRGRGDVTRLTDLVTERDAVEVVVGLPTTLRGTPGPAALAAEAYAGTLAERLGVPVRLVDERFSTVGAQRGLHASGVDTRRGRSVVDQAAAVIILQSALDAERSSGRPPGRIVERPTRPDDPGETTGNDSPGAEDEALGRPVEGER